MEETVQEKKVYLLYEPISESSLLEKKEKVLPGPNKNYEYWADLFSLESLVYRFADIYHGFLTPDDLSHIVKAKDYFLVNSLQENPTLEDPYVQYVLTKHVVETLQNIQRNHYSKHMSLKQQRMHQMLAEAKNYLAVRPKVAPQFPILPKSNYHEHIQGAGIHYPV